MELLTTPSDSADEAQEIRRLHALHGLNLLDTSPTEAFDRITRMAARLFDLPFAAVSLTDSNRQWFKSRFGVERAQMPRTHTPCSIVTESAQVLVVEDMLFHPDLGTSLLANHGIRFYAGAPLITRDGHCLGAMCVLGTEPRAAVDDEVELLRDMAAMVMAQIELQHALGRRDSLSGLPNRIQFAEDYQDFGQDRLFGSRHFTLVLKLATPEQLDAAVRVLGIGYLDELLKEAVVWLQVQLDAPVTIYQVGPTQFACILPGEYDEQALLAKLSGALLELASSGCGRFVTTATFGLAPFLAGQTDCLDVLRWGHGAASGAGDTPGRVAMFDPQHDLVYQRRFKLLGEFGAALECDDQLYLVFQPRIDLASGACVGAEALLRWNHPSLGSVSPAEFIPVIEQTSIVRTATAWVLNAALRQLAAWQCQGMTLTISVNVSASNLMEPDFAARVIAAVASYGVAPGMLELEITESAVLGNQKQATALLNKLADAGIKLAIDDFGTGYSSLSYLQNLPADLVKIDQSFIRTMTCDLRTDVLVATMISMSHALGYRVVAEGVETNAVVTRLRELGCDEVQGYFFARPLAWDRFPAWWRANEHSNETGDRLLPPDELGSSDFSSQCGGILRKISDGLQVR